jgi:hypothetical protein
VGNPKVRKSDEQQQQQKQQQQKHAALLRQLHQQAAALMKPFEHHTAVTQTAKASITIIINPCKPYLTASAPRLTHWGGGK